MRGSLRLRLLLAGAASILLALALAALGLTYLFERHVARWVDAELHAHLNQLAAGLDRSADGTIDLMQPPADPRFNRPLSGLYWQIVLDDTGRTIRSRSLWDDRIELPPEPRTDDEVREYRVDGPADSTLYLVQRRVALPARLGGQTARLAVALDASELRASTLRFARALTPFLLIIAALLIAAAWAQVSVGLKPLESIHRRLAAIRTGAARRLGSAFPEEVKPLAQEVDALLEAREAQIETARSRAADLAHGMRTPLQVISGEVSRLRAKGEEESAGEIEAVADSMWRQVERHLARARMAAGSMDASADIGEVIERVARVLQRAPEGAALRWRIDVQGIGRALIDVDDLAEAIGNLVENAVRHASSQIAISGRLKSHLAVIEVTDDGPGIPKNGRDAALLRGERLDADGFGTGLGLAIAAEIAHSWGGGLRLEDASPGLSAVLSLPRRR